MDVPKPALDNFRRDWINELEDQRLLELTKDREMSTASTSTLYQEQSQSRESTATLRNASEFRNLAPEENSVSSNDRMDIDPVDQEVGEEDPKQPIIFATDFGTTFSAAAYAIGNKNKVVNHKVKVVANYPDDPRALQGKPGLEVPTESWYPNKSQASPDIEMMNANNAEFDDLYDVSDREEDDRFEDEVLNEGEDQTVKELGSDDEIRNFVWGYGIQKQTVGDMDISQFNRISRSKLLLDVSEHTQKVRNSLRDVLKRLKQTKIIRESEDVIADYLTHFFLHAKQQLMLDGITDTSTVEHVICVPVVWSSKALRTMQSVVEIAIRKSEFGSLKNLFFVSEPEAAAAFVLGRSQVVNAGEAFVILDAGGGTVDATTYKVDIDIPLRLSEELVTAAGCLHGSSYLNEDFKKHLLDRLKDEADDIERDGYTIEGMVDVEALAFENRIKRTMDITNERLPLEAIAFRGLKPDRNKRFGTNRVFMNRSDFRQIFDCHLKEIWNLVRDQLTDARTAGHQVQKVVVVGGFSGSPSLRNYLKIELRKMSKEVGYTIKLIDAVDSDAPETAVAQGAVLRALDKENGPRRKTSSSYGFLRTEEHAPMECEAHKGIRPSIDKLDGLRYVRDTIEWLVKKGDDIPIHAEYKILANHTFPITRKRFLCEEVLYVSDTCTESHYRRTHPINKGKVEPIGTIIIDMAPLVAQGKVEIKYPEPGDVGKPHYKFEFEVVMKIDGRNLSYEARWPALGKAEATGRRQTSIAAAFRPGTN